MCSTHDYEHLIPDPDEDFGLMAPDEVADHLAWRDRIRAEMDLTAERARLRAMAGLPKVEDAFTFARSLRVVR